MDEEPRVAVPPKVTFRSTTRNVTGACVFAVVFGGLLARPWYSATGFRTSWWTLPVVVAFVAAVAVRFLRRAVVVSGAGIARRSLFATRLIPWWTIRDVRLDTSERRGSRGRTTRFSATSTIWPTGEGSSRPPEVLRFKVREPATRPEFAHVLRHFERAAARSIARGEREPAAPSDGWLPSVLICGCAWLVLLIGVLNVDNGVVDRDAYLARAARDADSVALVSSSEIIARKDDDGDPKYSTRVRVEFPVEARIVRTTIERPGRHRFVSEQELPIVYDAAHPYDADFRDRHNRRANLSSAELHIDVGAVMSLLAAAVLVTVSLVRLQDRRGARRRTERGLAAFRG